MPRELVHRSVASLQSTLVPRIPRHFLYCLNERVVHLPATLVHEIAHSLLNQQEHRAEKSKRICETEAEPVAFLVCGAIGLEADNSADYIQLYSGDKDTLTESLEHVQRVSAEILAAITASD